MFNNIWRNVLLKSKYFPPSTSLRPGRTRRIVAAEQSARRVVVTHVIISSHIGGDQQLLGNMNNLNVSSRYVLKRNYCDINYNDHSQPIDKGRRDVLLSGSEPAIAPPQTWNALHCTGLHIGWYFYKSLLANSPDIMSTVESLTFRSCFAVKKLWNCESE